MSTYNCWMLQPRLPWHLDFARRVDQHRPVTIDRLDGLSPADRHALAQSIATFQVGEHGEGEHLLSAASESQATERYKDALSMFIVEEQEHARLLGLVLTAIDAPLRTSHWTERVFVMLRRLKSLRTEVLTLLVAELIALSYYSSLSRGVPQLAPVFERICEDELRHIDFHADTLPRHLNQWSPAVRMAVRMLWNVLVTGASVVVAFDHRKALRVARVSPWRFMQDVWSDRQGLDQRLFA